jgi:mRNA-degrading endonuclease RelE of RelBE toxin-antitoxin system
MYSIRFKKSAEKEISKLPLKEISLIRPVIDGLAINLRPHGSKKLESQKNRFGEYVWVIIE